MELFKDQNDVTIKISDDGPGFPNDILKVIGEPYISSKLSKNLGKEGLGLGTFIGKTLLERKKASIEFFNEQKGGAVVNISWQIHNIRN